jgi:hypothetical protein
MRICKLASVAVRSEAPVPAVAQGSNPIRRKCSSQSSSKRRDDKMKCFTRWVSRNTALLALVVTTMNVYMAHSSYKVLQGTQTAAIFSQFQLQYNAIAARFPADMLKPDFRPMIGSDDFRKLRDYWIFCYAQWYETNKADPGAYNDLWVTYYSGLVLNAMDIPSLRYALIIMMQTYGHQEYMQEFYDALRQLAADKGKPLIVDAVAGGKT